MKVLPVVVLVMLVGGVASDGAFQLFSINNSTNSVTTPTNSVKPAPTPTIVTTAPKSPLFQKAVVESIPLSNNTEEKSEKAPSSSLELDKTYYVSEDAQKQFVKNDPNAVIFSVSKPTIPTKELAAIYKANAEKGPVDNKTGWYHILIGEGNAYSIVNINQSIQNTKDKFSALFTTKGNKFKDSVDQNAIHVELNGAVTDVELQALGKLLKELNKDGTMPPNRVFARWAVTPSTSTQDNTIINPNGKTTPQLTKLVEYAGYPAGSEMVIIKSNLQNKILLMRDKTVTKTPNDFSLELLVKAYNAIK